MLKYLHRPNLFRLNQEDSLVRTLLLRIKNIHIRNVSAMNWLSVSTLQIGPTYCGFGLLFLLFIVVDTIVVVVDWSAHVVVLYP